MKCYAMQKQKHKLSTKVKKELRRNIDEYMRLSMIYGHTTALQILKQRKESEVEGNAT